MSSRVMKNLLAMLEAEEAEAYTTNNGTANAFNNHGGGDQNFSGANINSGANSGDRKKFRTTNNLGDRTVNNSGTFHGNGNGGYTEGNSDASTKNYKF
ncbi:hyphally regulated cell wall protein 3-like [Vicia villosa]|uniref:hyphally regulated cell wall protein 3-like n=1 Tax=Vicia villosa TaxID=3911 RepID=UPI00273C94A2|nr:hyphally regulated cell wall protein 3-like [Vicia villosa]